MAGPLVAMGIKPPAKRRKVLKEPCDYCGLTGHTTREQSHVCFQETMIKNITRKRTTKKKKYPYQRLRYGKFRNFHQRKYNKVNVEYVLNSTYVCDMLVLYLSIFCEPDLQYLFSVGSTEEIKEGIS
jgi:hypothetical protein